MDSQAPAIVWFRQDLRTEDNPALAAAAAGGRPIVPLYILDDAAAGRWRMGGASRWWLHGSLAALDATLRRLGTPLVLRRGRAAAVIAALVRDLGAGAVHWNRCYEPWAIARDTAIKSMLTSQGVAAHSTNAGLLAEPWTVATGAGTPFKVFTPFWRAMLAAPPPPAPMAAPKRLRATDGLPACERLEDWSLRPTKPDWAAGLRAAWTPGEAAALQRLAAFVDAGLAHYAQEHDRPDRAGSSRLSPHLHFGEIGPRQVWHAVQTAVAAGGIGAGAAEVFLRELIWREFTHHLLFHAPDLPDSPWRRDFVAFPYRDDPAALAAWQQGRTGYPIVDAGLRELWTTGWMHNRVRMIAASFLVKDQLIDWRAGQAWFWDTLVDADLAQNAASWQWVAGCGADAAPYFRIFNPILQGRRFDPDGDYVRRWLPALAPLPAAHIHAPWLAPPGVFKDSSLRLGRDYPLPVVDHAAARARALAAFRTLR